MPELALDSSFRNLVTVLSAAFKEWAIVVDSLGRGEQIFILRKGGIHEGPRGFKMEHPAFLLFPTLFHQQRACVIPSAQARFDQIAPRLPPPEILRLEYWAEVVEYHRLDSFAAVQRLKGQHIWEEQVLAERFEWGRSQGIYAIALRVHRLPVKVELPMIAEYGGCKSWIETARPIQTGGSTPVLEQSRFDEARARFRACLD